MKILFKGTCLAGQYSEHPVIAIRHDNQRLMPGIKNLGNGQGGLLALSAKPDTPCRADRYTKTAHTITNMPQSVHARNRFASAGRRRTNAECSFRNKVVAFSAGLNIGV